jgi:hypothetical protein
MEAFIATLKEFGPFTLPICIVMVWAIKWLLGDRERLLTELKAARDDATAIRDKRVEDKELLEYGDAVTHRLEEWSKRTSEKE